MCRGEARFTGLMVGAFIIHSVILGFGFLVFCSFSLSLLLCRVFSLFFFFVFFRWFFFVGVCVFVSVVGRFFGLLGLF